MPAVKSVVSLSMINDVIFIDTNFSMSSKLLKYWINFSFLTKPISTSNYSFKEIGSLSSTYFSSSTFILISAYQMSSKKLWILELIFSVTPFNFMNLSNRCILSLDNFNYTHEKFWFNPQKGESKLKLKPRKKPKS